MRLGCGTDAIRGGSTEFCYCSGHGTSHVAIARSVSINFSMCSIFCVVYWPPPLPTAATPPFHWGVYICQCAVPQHPYWIAPILRLISSRKKKVVCHYPDLAVNSGVKNDSSWMSKLTALFHCTWQSVVVGDKTAGTSLAFVSISCVFAYSREWRMNTERNSVIVVYRRDFLFNLWAHCNVCSSFDNW